MPRRALIVEDDQAARHALQQLFEHHGWEVTVAPTVREAKVALLQPLAWVVLDLVLPDGDGASVLELIRHKQMDLGVVVITGLDDRESLRHIAALEPDAVLTKPVDFDEILNIIAND